jgi:hypothetical protein
VLVFAVFRRSKSLSSLGTNRKVLLSLFVHPVKRHTAVKMERFVPPVREEYYLIAE